MRMRRPISGLDVLKSRLKRAAGVIIAVEVGCAVSAYWGFRKVNRDQEFRYYLHHNWPTVLSTYYSFCSLIGDEYDEIQLKDQEAVIMTMIKSLFYLVGFTGVGYVLMKFVVPSDEELSKALSNGRSSPQEKKLFIDALKKSAGIDDK